MEKIIIGRNEEQKELQVMFDSESAHFLAVTGRRRIGKTYLINSFFHKRLSFGFTGMLHASYRQQLQNFHQSLSLYFKVNQDDKIPADWLEAFHLLSKLLQKSRKSKQVVFIDELPWLDTHKSNFMAALDWFWNSWASDRNVLLIVCGSSTSWMINRLINNRGGLHNRLTKRIHLEPFTLHETEKFLKHNKIILSHYQLLQLYMILGGVPHYLKEVRKGESAMQAVDRICFQKSGLLVNEFENLYKALFKNSEIHVRIVFALSSRKKGLTRTDLLKLTKLKDGGSFTKILDELEWCNFIIAQQGFGKIKKDTLYRLCDEFSLFYIKFMYKKRNVNWLQLSASPTWRSWSGYAFESCCMKHTRQLKYALGISGVYTEEAGFICTGKNAADGTQIDLLIDRNDHVINLCEVKFHDKEFVISKGYASQLWNKVVIFRDQTKTNKTLFPTMITTYGVKPNEHSLGLVQQEVRMEDLFEF